MSGRNQAFHKVAGHVCVRPLRATVNDVMIAPERRHGGGGSFGADSKSPEASTWVLWLLGLPPSSESSLPTRFCSAVSGDAQIDVVIGRRLTSHRSEIVVV